MAKGYGQLITISSDMNVLTRIDSYLKVGDKSQDVCIGHLDGWEFDSEEKKLKLMWRKFFKSTQIICVHWNAELKIVVVGCDSGTIHVVKLFESDRKSFKDITIFRVHQKRVMAIDTLFEDETEMYVYSIAEDGYLCKTPIRTSEVKNSKYQVLSLFRSKNFKKAA